MPASTEEQARYYEIDIRNFADPSVSSEAIRTKAKEFLNPLTAQAREDRIGLNDDLQACYNIWDTKTDVHWYKGRADLYIPAGHRTIERATAKQMARLFPTGGDILDVQASPIGDESFEPVATDLDAARALIWYDLNYLIKIRRLMLPFLRQLNGLGTSVLGADYLTEEDVQGTMRSRSVRLAKIPGQTPGGMLRMPREEVGPRGRLIDLLTFHVWPATVMDLDDATIVFEDVLVSKEYCERERARGRFAFTDDQLKQVLGKFPQNSIWSSSDRLTGRTETGDPSNALTVCTYAYALWNPPIAMASENATEDAFEDKVPFQFAILGDGDVCVMARQNPWWHQRAPYVSAKLYEWINEFYGRGLVYFIKKLQYQLNDTARQTFDAMSYSLNPIAAVDPILVPDPDVLQYRPGAKWPVPPNAIRWMQMPATHLQGFAAIRQLFEMVQEIAGAATGGQYLPTLGVPRGAETATGQSLLVAQSDIDVAMVCESVEEMALQPYCQLIDSMEQQFIMANGKRLLQALGRKAIPLLEKARTVTPENLLGRRSYFWTGSHISSEKEQLQKVGSPFLKIANEMQPDQNGSANKWRLAKNIYRSYGFQDADAIWRERSAGGGLDPQMELLVMLAGHYMPPKLGEDYLAHLQAHDQQLLLPEVANTEGAAERVKQHMAETMATMREDPEFVKQMVAMQQQAGAVPSGTPSAQPMLG